MVVELSVVSHHHFLGDTNTTTLTITTTNILTNYSNNSDDDGIPNASAPGIPRIADGRIGVVFTSISGNNTNVKGNNSCCRRPILGSTAIISPGDVPISGVPRNCRLTSAAPIRVVSGNGALLTVIGIGGAISASVGIEIALRLVGNATTSGRHRLIIGVPNSTTCVSASSVALPRSLV